MSGYAVSTSVGRITPGEVDSIWYPRSSRVGRYGVVLVHGSSAPSEFIDNTQQPSSVILAAALASCGIPCIAGEFGGNGWASDAVMSGIDAARAVLASEFPDMATDKVLLLGISMGGAAVARYSQLNASEVAGAVGIIPALDLRYEYENVAATRADIGTAWGVTYPAALPVAADTRASASLASSVPLLVGYSSIDPIVPPSPVLSYVSAVGGTAMEIDSTTGHSDATVGKMPISTVARFLASCGA